MEKDKSKKQKAIGTVASDPVELRSCFLFSLHE